MLLVSLITAAFHSDKQSVGTTCLSSGITIEMINEFYEKAHTFSSVEDIEERLPVFSHNHEVAFWNVLNEILSDV